MIIWWPQPFGSGGGGGVYTDPGPENVKKGREYIFNNVTEVGTYVPTLQKPNFGVGTVPFVGDAMLDWFQPMVFGIVTKTNEGFQVLETDSEINFRGVWQPFTERQLMMKPEGQRAWSWYWLHSDPTLELKVDDIVDYEGKQYRVMTKKNFTIYGYIEYHIVTDWTGSGPTPGSP